MIVTAIVARNEAHRDLAAVLDRATQYSDEVLVLDDNSTDDTPQIARRRGAKVKHRKAIQPLWGHEASARAELWAWATAIAKDGWVIITDADMLLEGDPRPLTLSWACNTWSWVLYDLWSETEFRTDEMWRGHLFPRPWMFRPRLVPPGWVPEWPDRGLHTGHCPVNWPLVGCVVGPEVVHWRHRAYVTPERRQQKHEQYLRHADQLTDFERRHADSILAFDR